MTTLVCYTTRTDRLSPVLSDRLDQLASDLEAPVNAPSWRRRDG